MSELRVSTVGLSIALAVLALVGASGLSGATERGREVVSDSDAREALDRIEQEAEAARGRPDPDAFCARTSSDLTMCAMSLERMGSAYPVGTTTVLKTQSLDDGSRIMWLTGDLSDGTTYRSFVQIVPGIDAERPAVDAVYWASREFTQEPEAQPYDPDTD